MYVRKHWYEVATVSDGTMKLISRDRLAGVGREPDGGCSAFVSQRRAQQRYLKV
jgi:hypothetical protein